jgi:alpha-L-rhamnosidase
VDQGATTIWERWDGYTKERGFGPVAMNSFNHYAYGAVLGWMYRTMAGIRPGNDAGYRHFTLAPKSDKRIGSCKASYRTKYGMVKSEWRYADGGKLEWSFTVPPGTTATIIPPDGSPTVERGPGDYRW